MDCAVEESEIRKALEPISGIRSLGFQLGARTLRIDATSEAYPLALAAIRKAGFDPKPLPVAGSGKTPEGAEEVHGHEHGFSGGVWRMVLALAFAICAEILSYLAPETMAWKIGGMAVAGVLVGVLLTFFGYQANQEQTPLALTGIALMLTIIPGFFHFLMGMLMFKYRISDTYYGEVKADMRARGFVTS